MSNKRKKDEEEPLTKKINIKKKDSETIIDVYTTFDGKPEFLQDSKIIEIKKKLNKTNDQIMDHDILQIKSLIGI
jgi:hypothetical protein